MASTGNPSPNSKRTERAEQRRTSRVSFATETKGSNVVDGGRRALPSRPKVDIPPSDHAPSSHTTSGPVADKPDDEFLKRAKGFIDELYQQHIVLDTKHRCLEYYREKVVFYLGDEQKCLDSRSKKGKQRSPSIDDLQRAHRELVKYKEKGFGADGNSNDKPNADIEAFSENILNVLPRSLIGGRIDVLSYLNKAVEALRKLCNTYNGKEISKLKEEYHQLLKDRKQLQQRQQSASEQASTATTKSTANPDLYHSNVVKLYQRAENMRYQEDADSQLRKDLTAKLDRQMEKTERLRRKLEAPIPGIDYP
ncbi:hypothetical protein ACEPAI_10083 [Sanghuangporus weigelae]